MNKYTQENWPADRWPNFSFDECKCKQTGECYLDDEFMDKLQELRTHEAYRAWRTFPRRGWRHILHTQQSI